MISIVTATQEDLQRILELERESLSPPWTHDALRGEIIREDSFFPLAVENGHILGFCILRRSGDEGELFQIAVDKSARRRGLGDILMRSALMCAAENSLEKVFLEVRASNEAAISLYKKHGFIPCGVRKKYYDSPVEDALIMTFEADRP